MAGFFLIVLKANGAFINIQMSLLCLLMLFSCGSGFGDVEVRQEEVIEGWYTAVLNPLNSKVGIFSGRVDLSMSDNQFWVRVNLKGPQTNEMHPQFLHTNSSCPTMKDDLNRDGYLDFIESYRVAGPILMPLDSNLNSQMKGLHEFPHMRKNSSYYYYSEACNSDYMLSDLKRKDEYKEDLMTKLRPSEKLNLKKRVVLIYGASSDRYLPDTVGTFDGYPNHSSVPIACGEISTSGPEH